MEFHEVTNLFPMMQEEEFKALVEDIRQNGLLEPIWTYQGKIIDGRNRYRACKELGMEPKYREWDGNGSLVQFVVSFNLHRRHLTASQKAAAALEAEKWLAKEAKERQREHGKTAPGRPKTLDQKIEQVSSLAENRKIVSQKIEQRKNNEIEGRAAEQAAKLFGTNRQYVCDAKKLAEEAPDLIEKVKTGELSIVKAKRELVKRQVQEPPKLEGKYRVIYADPPWKYGNTMPEYFKEQADHYPLMTIDEICALPVKELAEDNAVLFLWATSPILEDVFKVINAWGFKYKASFVWDKVKHNMGHYNSVRHEFLLIATRGSCLPDVPKLFDSVVSVERTAHSEKPEIFREIIDTLYPYGRRIELFARKRIKGWDVYGNQLPDIQGRQEENAV